jgi:hypothetical protein
LGGIAGDREAIHAAADDKNVECLRSELFRVAKHVGLYYPA